MWWSSWWVFKHMNQELVSLIKKYFELLSGNGWDKLWNSKYSVEEIETRLSENESVLSELKSLYIELANIRNRIAISRLSSKNYFEYSKEIKFKIPENDWNKFSKNKNLLVEKFPIKSELIRPNFFSKTVLTGISYPDSVLNLFSKNIRNKVNISVSVSGARYKHEVNSEKYFVEIPEVVFSQKVSMLIHEMSHVEAYEKLGTRINSLYRAEKEAMVIEFEKDKQLDPLLFQVNVDTYLYSLLRSEFQEKIYSGEVPDYGKLYKELRKTYFGPLNDNGGDLYLLDKQMIIQPLIDLGAAVAIVNVLT